VTAEDFGDFETQIMCLFDDKGAANRKVFRIFIDGDRLYHFQKKINCDYNEETVVVIDFVRYPVSLRLSD
jgi:hypothetical protein